MNKEIKKGDRGFGVEVIQDFLGLLKDGIFGANTEEAVKLFQKDNGIEPDGIVGKKTWDALTGMGVVLKSRRIIKEIIVHCTATREGKDVSIATIKQWHRQRGWSDIGYHYIVDINGNLQLGRDVNIAGAHCVNHNARSIGVCYVGGLDKHGKPKDTRTPKQKETLLKLLKDLKKLYPAAKIYGHCDFSTKACPCFNAKEEYKNL